MEHTQPVDKEAVDARPVHPSGQIKDPLFNIADHFTHYSEIRSYGYNCLYKAQRHGKWFFLKGLKQAAKERIAKRVAAGDPYVYEMITLDKRFAQ